MTRNRGRAWHSGTRLRRRLGVGIPLLVLLAVLPAAALGSFSSSPLVLTDANNPSGIGAADLNGDGSPDLVAANFSGGIPIYMNTTVAPAATPQFDNGSSNPALTLTDNNEPSALAFSSLNQTSNPDIIVADQGGSGPCGVSGCVQIFHNTTPSGWAAPSFVSTPTTLTDNNDPDSVAVGDFQGTGAPDIAVANFLGGVWVFPNTTAAGSSTLTFGSEVTLTDANSPSGLAVGDLTGDGMPDVVAANRGGSQGVSVFTDTTVAGASTPTFTSQSLTDSNNPEAVALVDLNGDGKPDVVVANQTNPGTFTVFMNTTTAGATTPTFGGGVTFGPSSTPSIAIGNSPSFVAAADFNGDGAPDVVFSDAGTGHGLYTVLNTTAFGSLTPSFSSSVVSVADVNFPHAIVASDLSGDGAPDIAVANYNTSMVDVFANTSVPTDTPSPASVPFATQALATISSPQTVTITNNGDFELAVNSVRVGGANPDDFLLANDTCAGQYLATGESCTIDVRFAPTATGARAATLELSDDASDVSVALSGTGGQLPSGPAGPQGAQGATGPAGQVELVKCTSTKVKQHGKTKTVQHCTTSLTSSPTRFTTSRLTFSARLTRNGVLYARGTAREANGATELALHPLRGLIRGTYELTLVRGGRRQVELATIT